MRRALGLAVAAVAACALAAPAAFASHGRVIAKSQVRTVTLGAGATRSFSAGCPRRYIVAAAATRPLAGGVSLVASVPGTRRWAFRVRNGTERRRRAKAVLRCVRVKLTRPARSWRVDVSNRSETLVVGAGERASATVDCPAGYTPTGYGFHREPRVVDGVGTGGQVRLYQVKPDASGVSFGLQETAGAAARADLHVRCIVKRGEAATRSGSRGSFRLRVLRRSYAPPLTRRTTRSRRRCAPGDFSLSAGFSFDPTGPASLLNAHTYGRRTGYWLWRSAAGARELVGMWLVCIDGRTRFRRG